MFASRLFVSFLALGAVAVSASPATLQKRAGITDVLSIVTDLSGNIAGPLTILNSQAAGGTATTTSVTAPITSIVGSLTGAAGSLTSLGSIDTSSGGSITDVASAVAPVLSTILTTFGSVNTVVPGGIVGLLGILGFQVALNQVLEGLEILLDGILNLLSGLLVEVAGILSTLGLLLTLLLLGLGL